MLERDWLVRPETWHGCIDHLAGPFRCSLARNGYQELWRQSLSSPALAQIGRPRVDVATALEESPRDAEVIQIQSIIVVGNDYWERPNRGVGCVVAREDQINLSSIVGGLPVDADGECSDQKVKSKAAWEHHTVLGFA